MRRMRWISFRKSTRDMPNWVCALREMVYSVQDVGYELRDILDHMESDPELIEKVSKRLETIDRLERKYGTPIWTIVLNFYASAVERLESIQTGDAHIDALKAELAKKDAELGEVCTLLTASRPRACAAPCTGGYAAASRSWNGARTT